MDEFSERALQARENDEEFNRFAADSKSYILGCASKCLKRYIRDTDDEWSVALIAFHEAVRTYKPEKGGFGSFAGIVIRRRLLDEERRNAAYGSEIPVSPEVLVGEYSGDEEDAEVIVWSEMSGRAAAEKAGRPSGPRPCRTRSRQHRRSCRRTVFPFSI